MRISDWSSDVCSSDLKPPIQNPGQPHSHEGRCRNLHQRSRDRDVSHRQQVTQREMQTNTEHEEDDPDLGKLIGETGISNKARSKGTNQDASEQIARDWRDRKRDVEGKSVSVRVDHGGRGIVKKKK